ncbi:cyclin-dependent kinase inhibitor 3 isoform X5 [Tympanuchus pallidicinctus]|uniref:cyclin-dependent kinase inhibitor 3 isoform X5 n=1 Tax=Tympanuchus pallidicinctus TaxID=109042 RepID=UPI00228767E5|nr:cyclin-dependent kinase inhibitor 3 isoform X5 [Tympanuchus pallidicinctus]
MHVAGFDSSDEEAAEEEEGEEPAPLPLSWLPLPPAYSSAFLAVCSLPGCRFKDIRRNLQKDIDELKSCGTQDVFVLCTKGELLKYRVPNLIDAYQERGICVHHYPIPDGDAPDVTTCCTILEELRSCLESNRKTIIHSTIISMTSEGVQLHSWKHGVQRRGRCHGERVLEWLCLRGCGKHLDKAAHPNLSTCLLLLPQCHRCSLSDVCVKCWGWGQES